MLNPYTMERLNAERLKDLDREAAGLHFSMLARHNRRRILKSAWRRCVRLLAKAAERVGHTPRQPARLAGRPAHEDQ